MALPLLTRNFFLRKRGWTRVPPLVVFTEGGPMFSADRSGRNSVDGLKMCGLSGGLYSCRRHGQRTRRFTDDAVSRHIGETLLSATSS